MGNWDQIDRLVTPWRRLRSQIARLKKKKKGVDQYSNSMGLSDTGLTG